MKLTLILMSTLALASAAFADDSSALKPQFADCTENARKIGEAIAASAPYGKVSAVRTEYVATTQSAGADDKIETTKLDLDPHHPTRSYYFTVTYPIPQEDDYDARLKSSTVYRVSYEDGRWSQDDAAKVYREGCYIIGIDVIHAAM
jgi:hypothetical protein